MFDTKQKEKERLSTKAFDEMREWLTTMPLSNKNVEKNLYYISDFIAVASHLQLPQNSRVLELGSGSCWPSEWLYRMGYRTVSADISHDMLRLGRERFLPLRRKRDNFALHAHFTCTDADFLPFKDAAFDAIIIFNAFHHFPNYQSALKEMNRILSPSGKLILAEPGEGHADSDEAKREMAEHGVLEKDVNIHEIAELAENTGFARTEIILHHYPDSTVSYEHWKTLSKSGSRLGYRLKILIDLMRWRRRHHEAKYMAELIHRQRRHPCLVLKKGRGVLKDSRLPGLLQGRLQLQGLATHIQAGHPFRLEVEAENNGDTLWLCQGAFLAGGAMNMGEGGYVNLGVKLFSREGVLVDGNYGRGAFRHNISPGEKSTVAALLHAPDKPGKYRLKIDLVDEGITWFEDRGSVPLETDFEVIAATEPPLFESRFPDILSGKIIPEKERISITDQEKIEIMVEVENLGNTVWLHQAPEDDPPTFGGGFVRLGLQLHDSNKQLLDLNFGRFFLPTNIRPGEKVRLSVSFMPPAKAGKYHLFFDLVDEQIAWFSERGSVPAILSLVVNRSHNSSQVSKNN